METIYIFLSRDWQKFNWFKINVLIRVTHKKFPFPVLFLTEFRTTSPWVALPPPTSDINLESWTSCLPIIKWAEQCFITDLMWLSLAGLLSAPGYAVLTQVIFCCGLLMLPQDDRVMCFESQWGALLGFGFFVFCFSPNKEWVLWKVFCYSSCSLYFRI